MMPPLLWAEFSIQFLIPAIFLVIWALNQVFGRSEAPPPAVGRDRLGPRPLPAGPSRAPQPSRGAQGTRTGPSASPRTQAGRPTGRGEGKARDRAPAPQARPTEPARTPKPRPAIVDEVYAIYEDDRARLQAVETPPTAILSSEATRRGTASITGGPVGSPILTGVLREGFDPERLREAFILAEVLGPPAAARRKPRMVVPEAGKDANEA